MINGSAPIQTIAMMDAEFWCRLLGEAIDSLDTLAADDEFFGTEESRQDYASRRADEIRAKYIRRVPDGRSTKDRSFRDVESH